MTLILLLDLDDTLLSNQMLSFQPAYLKALGRHLSRYIAPEKMIPELLTSTQKMLSNNRPDQTLEDVFDASFYPALGIPKQDLRLEIECFYSEVFPSLEESDGTPPGCKKTGQHGPQKGMVACGGD